MTVASPVRSPSIAKGRPASLAAVGTLETLTGLTVSEHGGSGIVRQTVLTLTDLPLTLTDALAYLGTRLYTFPEGRINVLDCVIRLTFTTTSTLASTLNSGATVSVGVGSAAASSSTLATTMQNFCPGSGESVNNFTSSTTINVAASEIVGVLAAVSAAHLGAILNGVTTPVPVYLNIGVPTGTDIDGDATLTVSGTITLTWINTGDT